MAQKLVEKWSKIGQFPEILENLARTYIFESGYPPVKSVLKVFLGFQLPLAGMHFFDLEARSTKLIAQFHILENI